MHLSAFGSSPPSFLRIGLGIKQFHDLQQTVGGHFWDLLIRCLAKIGSRPSCIGCMRISSECCLPLSSKFVRTSHSLLRVSSSGS